MSEKRNYAGIDYFRFLAALLIIAIHTSPLASYSEIGDFALTRIVARVAVPFFLMTSGYFLVRKYSCNNEKLWSFVKKTALIYVVAMVVYIPINIYTGYFGMDNLLPNIIKDIFFDGTLYHLWYLPASIMGGMIAWFLVKKLDYGKAFLVTFILYLIGLFGDSYYGISEKVSVVANMYDAIFQVSDHTRNGIFMAPIFFVMGGMIARKRGTVSLKKNVCGFVVTFLLMFVEGMLLHKYDMQRHDSMYLFLLPCMYFLFSALLSWRGNRIKWLRNSSLVVYIIHPMMIVAIRLFAKIAGLTGMLVENSLIHFLAVAVVSVIFAVMITMLWDRFVSKNMMYPRNTDRAWIEVELESLEHNVKVLNESMPEGCKIMAVVKDEAYGHSAFEISAYLCSLGVKSFAVATIDEGIKLRKCGIDGDVLILGYTNPTRACEMKKYDLMQSVVDYEYANELEQQGISVKAHIKIDTGMHRLGMAYSDVEKVAKVFSMKNIKVCGIYTHLSCSDSLEEKDIEFTNEQISKFYKVVDGLKDKGVEIPKLHIQSSYGLLNYPELKCDYIRFGVALYGILSTPDNNTKIKLDLKPVLSLKSRVALIRNVKKGEGIGYSRTFVPERDSKIAILPIGYGDGYPRNLSGGRGKVLINNQLVPVVGRVCMDQLTVDVTDVKDIKVGDIAILISKESDSLLATPMVADTSESISNEILSRMGARLPVVIK